MSVLQGAQCSHRCICEPVENIACVYYYSTTNTTRIQCERVECSVQSIELTVWDRDQERREVVLQKWICVCVQKNLPSDFSVVVYCACANFIPGACLLLSA